MVIERCYMSTSLASGELGPGAPHPGISLLGLFLLNDKIWTYASGRWWAGHEHVMSARRCQILSSKLDPESRTVSPSLCGYERITGPGAWKLVDGTLQLGAKCECAPHPLCLGSMSSSSEHS